MDTNTKRQAIRSFVASCGNKMWSVTYNKKTDGTIRTMVCKQNVFKHSQGMQNPNDGKEDLLPTYDMQAAAKLEEENLRRAYRTVWLDGVTRLKCGDNVLTF